MKTSTRPIRSRIDQAVPDIARVTRLRAVPSGNDASVVTRFALGEEARPWHMVPPARPPSAEANEAASSAVPSSEFYHEAHRRRAQFFRDLILAGIGAIFAAALKVGGWYRQSRQAYATYAALHQLDDRSLRDLGFTRDEIRSVAAEMAGQTEHSRRLARPTFPARPSLFELFLKQ